MSDGRPVGTWTPDPIPIYGVELGPDKRRLFLMGKTGIQVLDASDVPQLRELALIPAEIGFRFAVSPDGQLVAIASDDDLQIGVWRAKDGQLVRSIILLQKPKHLASCGETLAFDRQLVSRAGPADG